MANLVDKISDRDFRKLTGLIGSECGIMVAPAKRVMLETRLNKRVRVLGLPSLSAYCEYVDTPEGKRKEWANLVDAVTTHKTDFFREPAHFDFLIDQILPELAKGCGAGTRRSLQVWSSACSTGEEPYTIAMVLATHATLCGDNFTFRVHATDISEPVLETARRGVYPEAVIAPVPQEFRRRFLLRSKERDKALVRIIPEIRGRAEFRQLNLMSTEYGFADPLDVVFCRNVMIYFDRPTQELILKRIISTLRKGGYLLMGHSESLNGLDLPLIQVAPTVYRRRNG